MVKQKYSEWTEERVNRVRAMAAAGLSDRAMAVEMGVSVSAMIGVRWRLKINLTKTAVAEQPPADFAGLGPTMSIDGAKRHYKASGDTIKGWHKVCGTSPKKAASRKGVKLKSPRIKRPFGANPPAPIPLREDSVAAQAQYILQRLYPVYRAQVRDPRAPSDIWIVGGRRMTQAEMISIAERRGLKVAA